MFLAPRFLPILLMRSNIIYFEDADIDPKQIHFTLKSEVSHYTGLMRKVLTSRFRCLPLLVWFVFPFASAHAELPPVELMGMVGYSITDVQTPPSIYLGKDNAVSLGFLAQLELGPGKLETGFLYSKAAITVNEPFGRTNISGTYWMVPVLYRYSFLDPFFSLGAGFDYAVVGTRGLTVNGAEVSNISVGSGFRGHWGLQFSFQAEQDLGEDVSVFLDVRRRQGLAEAIAVGTESTRVHFWMLSLGIQKRLDP